MRNKLKLLLSGVIIGAAALNITNVSAATLNFSEGVKENNTITYEIYVTPDAGESLANKKITVSSNQNNINKSYVNTNDSIAKCEGDMCTILTDITEKTSIAKIKLTNTSETEITGVSISLHPDSTEWASKVETQSINLAGKEKTTTTTTTQKILSTKSELTNLTVSVGSMSPAFNTSERNYTVNGIKDTVNSITFNPTCENCKTEFTCVENCTVSETKNNRIMLEDGANTIKLTTKSEDGKNTTEYNFTVYRGEVEEPSAYLKELSIKDIELSPKFDMLLNDYSVSVDLEVEKLEIDYTLEDPEAKVEIKGADKLKEGENTVTITVTSSDGESKQVYTITVNKEDLCDPEKEECDEEKEVKDTVVIEKKKTNKTWLIVILVVCALAIIGASGFIIFRKKKKDKNKDDKNKNNKSGKGEKIKNAFIEPEGKDEEATEKEKEETIEEVQEEKTEEEIIKPRIKPSVDDALNDLMKTKEIELNNL